MTRFFRFAHIAMKVCPSGAGKSRYSVQPPASGSELKRPAADGRGCASAAHGEPGRRAGRARGRLGEEGPDAEAAAHRRRRQVPLELALAPVAHHLRQRDAHRADALAAAAEGRGVGQVARLVDADRASASAPRPSARDRPSRRRGRRSRDRPGSGSCRRRSGCSAACPGTRCRASPSGRCRAARRDTRSGPSGSPGRRGPVEKVV